MGEQIGKARQSQVMTREIEAPLRHWRAQVLNWLLAVGLVAGLPAVALLVIDLLQAPRDWSALILIGLYLVLVAFAVLRNLDPGLRAWSVLLVIYTLGVVNFGRSGLVGSGRVYLLVLPMIAIILIGQRAGVMMTIVSLSTIAIFAGLAQGGILAKWMFIKENPLDLFVWISIGTTTAVLMVAVVALLILYHRFQVRTLLSMYQSANALEQARALLQEQNRTLEARVTQRTAELAQAMRQIEQEKQNSEAIIQNSPGAIVTTDLEVNVVTWNPAAERLFGYPAAEAIGRNLDELVADHPDIRADAKAYTEQLASEGRIHAITRRTHRGGTLVEVEFWALPVIVAGERVGFVALYHDLTEIKQANEALQESHRQLANIINFMPDAVLVIDQQGRVIAWNRALEEMTGTKAEAMLGKGNYEYAVPFYGERRPILIDLVSLPQHELEDKYAHLRMEGQVLVGETYVPHLKGGGVYLLGTASSLHDSQGRIVGAIEVIRDFTERKHMEEALHQAKEAAEAARQQAEAARQQAEAATQAKSAFLAMMSHEIRTPMNAVIGMTGLLLDTPLSPQQREFAETIRTSGDALLTIINDILDFSKIEAGRMELESQPFDLRECVESAVDLLASRAAEKDLNLGCVIEPDVPAGITGDVTRLRQILVNLLSNAVKFTEEGEVVLTVTKDEGRQTTDDRRRTTNDSAVDRRSSVVVLHFAVRDTGIGIPLDRQGRLFRSFSQVDASTTRRFGGTGLGLAISKRLAELMDGKMWVESEGVPGKGSTFHFTIQAEAAEPLAPRLDLQGVQPRLEGKQVLIVDDNATNRHILSLQTRAWGMLPWDTGSPREALERVCQGEPFDLALVDVQMPEMDGMTLAREMRRTRVADQMPIVLLSSLGQRDAPADMSDFDSLGLAAYLLKPIKASQLYNVLGGIFGAGEVATALEEAYEPHFDTEMGRRHPLSILLAEDNAINQKLALLVLERLGYRADVAANGLEVLQSLQRQPYDVILMDVQMPEMDGLEAARMIGREYPPERRPRIVAMTANAMTEDREACFASGMDDYLTKPIQFSELVAALNRCQVRAANGMGERQLQRPLQGAETPVSTELPPVLDPAALERLRSTLGKQAGAMLPVLVENFFKDAPRLIAEAQRSWQQGQPAELRRAAHSLKSTSATFGLMALSALARELEYQARDDALEGADELLRQIQEEYARAREALEAI